MFLDNHSACCILLWTTGCVPSVAGLGGGEVDTVDKRKDSLLHDVAWWGHLSVVKLLVERVEDVRLKNNNGQTVSDMVRGEEREDLEKWLDLVSCG